MKNIFRFIIISLSIYIVLSMPMILGYGVEICFVEGVSPFSKVKAYLITGLENGFLAKLLISIASTITLLIVLKIKKK